MSNEKISLEHGAGGKAMMNLIKDIFLEEIEKGKELGEVGLSDLDDGAALKIGNENIIFTTDSHTIQPIFFPGGDIGRLAVAGTVNDMAVMGGKPLAMSAAVVMSEGFPTESLGKVVRSMNGTADEAGVSLVTGDTKVMDKGSLDDIIVTTTGIGIAKKPISDHGLNPGDKIVVTGNIGNHETSIISEREGIDVESPIESDVAPIWKTIEAGLEVGGITAMKDPTRGGVSGVLNEIADKSNVGIVLFEDKFPVSKSVNGICEMLGIDPLNLTNEGIAIIGVEADKGNDVLEAIRNTKYGKNAEIIGEAVEEDNGKVMLKTAIGGRRLVRANVGAPTPRIC
ncbi:hydrogenase expression protein [candidate division MSBL1 archaeon SCGC-AAA382C18]|uniref:Hydrogenase expression protein n=1 Tax=candidate division MSBL1 archaeon SCGC-AAA382C18 TaxID=1698281 RepID=A0A133VIE2_9EURY|nr:hydrogenase expression protein [candidate division MSBL1 archaeon SCGC-AAA382C18]